MSKVKPVKWLVAVGAAFLLATFRLPLAFGHDTVLEAVPAMDGTVSEFPHDIELTFSGEPKPDFNTLAISDSDTGTVVYRATPEVSGRVVSVHVPDSVNPGAGNYRIGYQITSSDGHSTRGFTRFSVAPPEGQGAPVQVSPQGTTSPKATASQRSGAQASNHETEDVARTTLWVALLVGVVALGVAAVVVMSKLKNSSTRKGK